MTRDTHQIVLDHLTAARHWAGRAAMGSSAKAALALIGECVAARAAAEQLLSEIEAERKRSVAAFVAEVKAKHQPTEETR